MTAAEAKLRAGDLAGCLSDLQIAVRKEPAQAKPRVFLAQLLMVTGEWDRALTQLAVVSDLDALALPMTRAKTVGVHPKFVGMIRELILERINPELERRAVGALGPRANVCAEDCCPAPLRPTAMGRGQG